MKRIFYIVVFLLMVVSGMAQQWHTTLDIWQAAPRILSDSIEHIIVVNNTVPQPLTFGHSTQQDDTNIGNVDVNLDKAATFMLLGATRTLDEARLFSSVGFVPESQNKSGNFAAKTYLNQKDIQQLCYDYQADAALVCNQLVIYDVLGSFLTDEYDYYAYLEAYLMSNWTLQFPNGKSQIFAFSDTLYWENRAEMRTTAITGLPNRQDALLDMSQYAGELFAQQFMPRWTTVDRYLYEDKHVGIQRGLQSFTHQHWEDAISIWQSAYHQTANSRNRSERLSHAYAAANIAVAYEILDNLTEARSWAEKAEQDFLQVNTAEGNQQAINIRYYIQQLNQRDTK